MIYIYIYYIIDHWLVQPTNRYTYSFNSDVSLYMCITVYGMPLIMFVCTYIKTHSKYVAPLYFLHVCLLFIGVGRPINN